MYDEYSKQLIDLLPNLPQIDRAQCRRALSSAYFQIVQSRLATTPQVVNDPTPGANQDLLRRMADALESVAVFDPLHGIEIELDVRDASAFVAAEALALLTTLAAPSEGASDSDILLDEAVYTAIEAGLLYMIGGYDANAIALARTADTSSFSVEHPNRFRASRLREAKKVVGSVFSLFLGEVRRSQEERDFSTPLETKETPVFYLELLDDVRSSV